MAHSPAWRTFRRTQDLTVLTAVLIYGGAVVHAFTRLVEDQASLVRSTLGLPAVFLFGTLDRRERPQRYRLVHSDVVVWGGPSRLAFHGVQPMADGIHALLGRRRINLTFRRVG